MDYGIYEMFGNKYEDILRKTNLEFIALGEKGGEH